MENRFTVTNVEFIASANAQRIDSFEIPVRALVKDGFSVRQANMANEVDYDENLGWVAIGQYISAEVLWDYSTSFGKQTTILDIQVGRGKTTACYDLIEKYSKDGEYVVIMLSPFKKLVDKDFNEVSHQRKLLAFNYSALDEILEGNSTEFIEEAVSRNIHIMTVNCLLNNPGDNAFDTSKIKKEYLAALLSRCSRERKKVVMFFDEIHEAIYNFEPQYVPHLYKWKSLVDKCFISSATFTAASYPVVKFIALLTNRRIMILSLDRIKWADEKISRLHLHIIAKEYNGRNLGPLIQLKQVLSASKEKQVNILTGTKSLADALLSKTDSKGNKNIFYESLEPFKFNLVTTDTESEFKPTGNNIGTTFKTGVNIKTSSNSQESVYIIILPVVKLNTGESIFSDGIPSIVQAIGRLRQRGDIHIFMYEPTHLIESAPSAVYEFMSGVSKKGYRFLDLYSSTKDRLKGPLAAKAITLFIDQYQSIDILKNEYNRRLNGIKNEVKALNAENGVGYQYPSFDDYLMERGQHQLVRNYPQFGSDLSSYILFASMNNQLCNANLTSITYTFQPQQVVSIVKEQVDKTLFTLLSEHVLLEARNHSLHVAIPYLLGTLRYDRVSDAELKFKYNGKDYGPTELRSLPLIAQKLVNNFISRCSNGKISELGKEDYILGCCLEAGRKASEAARPDTRLRAFARLNTQRKLFIKMLQRLTIVSDKGEKLIHRDAYKRFLDFRVEIIKKDAQTLNAFDNLISAKTFPFLPKLTNLNDPNKLKETVFKEFEKCFTNVSGIQRSYKGEKEAYYLVKGDIERVLPVDLQSVKLL